MGSQQGHGAPRGHFLAKPTTDKLCDYLDRAEALGIEVLTVQHMGGRDWVIITRGGRIPTPVEGRGFGPAGRRVFTQREE